MPNPWDVPPIPKRGDAGFLQTYAYVGFTITMWEGVEFELSRLYTRFRNAFDDPDIMDEYGKGRIFRERIAILAQAACEHFTKNPDQARESEFDALLARACGFADRRNEIAHGIVLRIDRVDFFRERIKPKLRNREHYALIPPLHAYRNHTPQGMPAFTYTSVEMDRFTTRFAKLQRDIRAFHSGPDLLAASPAPAPSGPSV